MLIDTDKIISVTQLQKELTKKIREVSEGGSTLYVLKNNEMEAVIVSAQEYEYLSNLSELIEYYEIEDTLKKRLPHYDRSKNIKWKKLRK